MWDSFSLWCYCTMCLGEEWDGEVGGFTCRMKSTRLLLCWKGPVRALNGPFLSSLTWMCLENMPWLLKLMNLCGLIWITTLHMIAANVHVKSGMSKLKPIIILSKKERRKLFHPLPTECFPIAMHRSWPSGEPTSPRPIILLKQSSSPKHIASCTSQALTLIILR